MQKDIYKINDNDLTYGRGYVYSLQYHIVWCTKYRKPLLQNGLDDDIKGMLRQLAEEYSFTLLAMEVMPDHIHLLLDCKPQFRISDMVKILKGNTARWLFMEHPELKQELWEDTCGTRHTVQSRSVTAAGSRSPGISTARKRRHKSA